MSDAKTWHVRCRQIEKELSAEKDKVDALEADNAALRRRIFELEDWLQVKPPHEITILERDLEVAVRERDALRLTVQELEDIITRYHPTDEQIYDRLTTLETLVKTLPKIKGTIFETVASCRGEGGPESWVRFEVALAALLTHRQSMDTPIDLSPKIKDDGGYGEHF